MKLGVNTVLFGGHDLRTAFEHLSWAGYGAAEVSALDGCGAFGDPLGEHLHLADWRSDAAMIRELREEFGLELTAMEVGPLDETRVRQAFEAGAELGIPVVNIGPSGKSGEPADLDECIRRMSALAAEAEQAGVCLCCKAHIGNSMFDTATTLQVMEAIDSPAFGIDMDPSHIFRGGEEPGDALRKVISRVRHVHIRDSGPGPAPGKAEEQACGRGDIDLFDYVGVLLDAGYEGPVNLEIIGASQYPAARSALIAAESLGFLRAITRSRGKSG